MSLENAVCSCPLLGDLELLLFYLHVHMFHKAQIVVANCYLYTPLSIMRETVLSEAPTQTPLALPTP